MTAPSARDLHRIRRTLWLRALVGARSLSFPGIRAREALVAQLDRALPSEGRGWRFESSRGRFSRRWGVSFRGAGDDGDGDEDEDKPDEDEDKLINDYMKKEWIQYREWKG